MFVYDYQKRSRGDRPEEWVPEEIDTSKDDNDVHDVYSDAAQRAVESGNRNIVDIFSIHSATNDAGNFSVITNPRYLCDCCIILKLPCNEHLCRDHISYSGRYSSRIFYE